MSSPLAIFRNSMEFGYALHLLGTLAELCNALEISPGSNLKKKKRIKKKTEKHPARYPAANIHFVALCICLGNLPGLLLVLLKALVKCLECCLLLQLEKRVSGCRRRISTAAASSAIHPSPSAGSFAGKAQKGHTTVVTNISKCSVCPCAVRGNVLPAGWGCAGHSRRGGCSQSC